MRDYGTGTWEGGDPDCDHKHETEHQKQGANSQRAGRSNIEEQRNENYRDVCGKCGARRVDQQLGLEPTPDAYVTNMVTLFREVRRVLRRDGTCWLNLGDSYASQGGPEPAQTKWQVEGASATMNAGKSRTVVGGLKPKDLVGIPWRVAFALQADGWYLRSDIIWAKPNPMPESVTDRPTKAHEYLFLLTRSPRYFYDADAIREPAEWARWGDQTNGKHEGSESAASWIGSRPKSELTPNLGAIRGDPDAEMSLASSPVPPGRRNNPAWNEQRAKTNAQKHPSNRNAQSGGFSAWQPEQGRNARSVWEIATQPYAAAHFATFPEELARRCIAAGTSEQVCAACGCPRPPLASSHASTTIDPDVRGLRNGLPQPESSVLLETVREPLDSSDQTGNQGLRHQPEGLQAATASGSSDGEPRGLHHGTSPSDGRDTGPTLDSGRGGPPSEWEQGGQPAGESGSDAQTDPRSETKATETSDHLSSLRRSDHHIWTCPQCGGRDTTASVVLDPFLGSGTTAHVARKQGRHSIGIELNPDYCELAARRLQQQSLLA